MRCSSARRTGCAASARRPSFDVGVLDDEDGPAARLRVRSGASPAPSSASSPRRRCHPDHRVARDAAAGQRRAVPDAAHRRVHGGGRRLHRRAQLRAQLRPAAAPAFALSAPGVTPAAATVAGTTRRCGRSRSAVPGAAGGDVRDLPAGVARDLRRGSRGDARVCVPDDALRADPGGRRWGSCWPPGPAALFGAIYKPEYGEGAAALPILVGRRVLPGPAAVVCAILNAAGRTRRRSHRSA